MIINSADIVRDKNIAADVCIVGAGPAGITIARELMNTNLDVVLLESGHEQPESDFEGLNSGKNIGFPYYDLEMARARAFGGASHRWIIKDEKGKPGPRLHGLDSIDFEKRDWIPYSGWPFKKEHLDPYYERAHEIFKIGPYAYHPYFWEEGDCSQPLPFEGENIETTMYQFARKDIFYHDYKKEIANAVNITTFLNSTVLKINPTINGEYIKNVLATSLNGNQFLVEAHYFILAAGGLETPRLLLLSDDVMKAGLGNQNDLVGRFFMEHPHSKSGVYYPSDPSLYDRTGLYKIHRKNDVAVMGYLTLAEHVLRKEKLLNFTTAIDYEPMVVLSQTLKSFYTLKRRISGRSSTNHLSKHIKMVLANLDSVFYAGLRKLMRGDKEHWYSSKKKYHGFRLNMMAEQIPDPESRLMLDSDRDRFGQRKIKLNWKLNSSDIRSIRRSQEILDRELREAKLGRLAIEFETDEPSKIIHGGWHHMGTTRMHNDPNQGVVDENCKVHGIKNLFIAGSSVFPTTGCANPTLTIIALAVRLSSHIVDIM